MNAKVWCGDARRVLTGVVPAESLRAVHVYFPDPWWKTRHKKRRVFTADLVQQIERTLSPGGLLNVASDVFEYFGVIRGLIASSERFREQELAEPGDPADALDYLTHFRSGNTPARRTARSIRRGICWSGESLRSRSERRLRGWVVRNLAPPSCIGGRLSQSAPPKSTWPSSMKSENTRPEMLDGAGGAPSIVNVSPPVETGLPLIRHRGWSRRGKLKRPLESRWKHAPGHLVRCIKRAQDIVIRLGVRKIGMSGSKVANRQDESPSLSDGPFRLPGSRRWMPRRGRCWKFSACNRFPSC